MNQQPYGNSSGEAQGYYGGQPQAPQYEQAPPNYGKDFQPGYGAPNFAAHDGKQSFDQTFKVEKPKLNDVSRTRGISAGA
jgi:hypothetical protein